MARLVTVVVAFVLLAATAGCGGAGEEVSVPQLTRPQIVAQLPPALSVARMRSDLRALQRIADRSGGSRAAGTAGYRESVAYVRTQLSRAGYAPRVQRFPFVEYRESVERGLQIAPARRDFPIEALEYSPSTPRGGLRAQVVPSGDGCQASDFQAAVRGAIALVRRGECFFAMKARNAAAAGASAVLIFNSEQGPFDGTLGDPQAATIPAAGIAGAVGAELAAVTDAVVELELVARSVRSTSQNVVTDVRPGARRVLVVGAHLDSVRGGPGINDNATGVTALLEIARVVRGRFPDLAVRFAFWGAEEAGLFGSRAYVSAAARGQIVGYLNFDVLGSSSGDYAIYQGPFAARWLAYFQRRGGDARLIDIAGRSDHAPFAQAGVPVGGLYAGDYACYHRACDRVSAIDFAVLETLARAAAWGIASFAPLSR
jgi:Zn-dependent M28 family amino/carboxypeptidase